MNDPYTILQEIIVNKLTLSEGEKIKLQYYLTHSYLKQSSEISWEPLPEPFSKYSISTDGRIKSYRFYYKSSQPHNIYPSVDSIYGTYYTLRHINKNEIKKGIRTDRLVIWAFCGYAPNQIKQVIHKDNNPFNNQLENLHAILK